jgi:hypothetical protein
MVLVFEDTKDNTMAKRKNTNGHTLIHKTQHRKPKIEQHEPHKTPAANPGVPEG